MNASPTICRDPRPTTAKGPPLKHLVRMSERRYDHTVETLCGLVRSLKPPRSGAVPCEKCIAIRDGIASLDHL